MSEIEEEGLSNNGGKAMEWGREEEWEIDKWNQRPKIGGQWKKYFSRKKFLKMMKVKEKDDGVHVHEGRVQQWQYHHFEEDKKLGVTVLFFCSIKSLIL